MVITINLRQQFVTVGLPNYLMPYQIIMVKVGLLVNQKV